MRSLSILVGCLLFLCPVFAKDKMYFDVESLDTNHDRMHVHIGHNVYIETIAVHKDKKGLYTFKDDIVTSAPNRHMKEWKCPYCHYYWKFGDRCQNPECPTQCW